MKKCVYLFVVLILLTLSQSLIAAPAKKKTESQKMKEEIARIEKRVNEINKEIEDYKKNEQKLDELEEKYADYQENKNIY